VLGHVVLKKLNAAFTSHIFSSSEKQNISFTLKISSSLVDLLELQWVTAYLKPSLQGSNRHIWMEKNSEYLLYCHCCLGLKEKSMGNLMYLSYSCIGSMQRFLEVELPFWSSLSMQELRTRRNTFRFMA